MVLSLSKIKLLFLISALDFIWNNKEAFCKAFRHDLKDTTSSELSNTFKKKLNYAVTFFTEPLIKI